MLRVYIEAAEEDVPAESGDEHLKSMPTLGKAASGARLPVEDVVTAMLDAAARSVKVESELTVELSGATRLQGKGDAQFLVFNLSGNAETTRTVKVTIKTKVAPR